MRKSTKIAKLQNLTAAVDAAMQELGRGSDIRDAEAVLARHGVDRISSELRSRRGTGTAGPGALRTCLGSAA